jgi:hypothetical protein
MLSTIDNQNKQKNCLSLFCAGTVVLYGEMDYLALSQGEAKPTKWRKLITDYNQELFLVVSRITA